AQAFTALAPESPAAAGDEAKGTGPFAYQSGLQAARMLRQLGRADQADQAYARVFEKYPQPENLDQRPHEWAVANHEAKKFERADEVFRRLIQEVPDSDLAD